MITNTHCLPCKGIKRLSGSKGHQCTRRTRHESGYCFQHRKEPINASYSKRPGAIEAKIRKSFKGAFSKWRSGEAVRVWENKDGTYAIERKNWRGSMVTLANACASVPRDFIESP